MFDFWNPIDSISSERKKKCFVILLKPIQIRFSLCIRSFQHFASVTIGYIYFFSFFSIYIDCCTHTISFRCHLLIVFEMTEIKSTNYPMPMCIVHLHRKMKFVIQFWEICYVRKDILRSTIIKNEIKWTPIYKIQEKFKMFWKKANFVINTFRMWFRFLVSVELFTYLILLRNNGKSLTAKIWPLELSPYSDK